MKSFCARLSGLVPIVAFATALHAGAAEPGRVPLTGLNLAGGEFGHAGGRFGFDYTYPSDGDLDLAVAKKFSVVRVPFLWERLQPRLGQDIDRTELNLLSDVVRRAAARKLSVILDAHNFGRYQEQTVGSPEVSVAQFASMWAQLATAFKNEPHAIFGLMNEPHDMKTEDWGTAASAALQAIRATGATNLILVPGNAYTGAHSWSADNYGTSNAVVMQGVKDPCGNAAFEFHQYLDADFSGTSPACQPPEAVVEGLSQATTWLRRTKNKGFLGEFGASTQPACLKGLTAMLRHMNDNADVWLGWTYWAAGSWWAPNYDYSVQPHEGQDRPQMAILETWRDKTSKLYASCRKRPQDGAALSR